jgi:hypothetical protein
MGNANPSFTVDRANHLISRTVQPLIAPCGANSWFVLQPLAGRDSQDSRIWDSFYANPPMAPKGLAKVDTSIYSFRYKRQLFNSGQKSEAIKTVTAKVGAG